jgi:hypothetical protein
MSHAKAIVISTLCTVAVIAAVFRISPKVRNFVTGLA